MRRRFPALYGWLWRLRGGPSGPPREESEVPVKYYKDERILRAIVGDGGLVVRGGPFAGTRYVSRPYGGAFYPKLLGSYEAEHRLPRPERPEPDRPSGGGRRRPPRDYEWAFMTARGGSD